MKTLTLPNDAQALIDVRATDFIGAPIAVPSGGSVTSSDPSLFSASVNGDGKVVVIAAPGATGTGMLTYTNGTMSDTASVIVAAPAAKSVELDVDDALLSAATPTPIAGSAPASSASV